MAQQTFVKLIDDIDGSEGVETVSFGLDGAAFEIDLNEKNAGKLRDALSLYIAHARRAEGSRAGRRVSTGTRRSGGAARTDREQLQAIRDWARKNGHQVSDRGRIAQEIRDAYDAAH